MRASSRGAKGARFRLLDYFHATGGPVGLGSFARSLMSLGGAGHLLNNANHRKMFLKSEKYTMNALSYSFGEVFSRQKNRVADLGTSVIRDSVLPLPVPESEEYPHQAIRPRGSARCWATPNPISRAD